MSDPVPGLTSVSYTCAYWDFLRRYRCVEPKPEQHGLTIAAARVLKAQIETEFANLPPSACTVQPSTR